MIRRVVEIYRKRDNAFLGAFPIRHVELAELQSLFGTSSDDPMYDAFPVTAAHRAALERAAGVGIDLARFEYYVTAEQDE